MGREEKRERENGVGESEMEQIEKHGTLPREAKFKGS